jgi:dTDP-4-amino-4,6-dideoxygalactose transaminase
MSPDPTAQLAVNGGTPVRTTPWKRRPQITPEEMAEFSATVLAAGEAGEFLWFHCTPEETYCREFGAYVGSPWVDLVSSGTTALWIALRALELEPFTEVVVSGITDPGGMMPIPLQNLIPMVADTEPASYNTGPEQIEACLTPLTRAIVVAHIQGEPADMVGIMKLARERGLPVIEDCSQAHGATLNGQMVGTFGDLGYFSTMAGKHHASAGQGALICCPSEDLYWRVRRAADRGKLFHQPPGSTNSFASLNLNGSDHAALWGSLMLRRLPGLLARRRELVARITVATADLRTLAVKPPPPGAECSYWFLTFRFFPERATCSVDTLVEALSAEGFCNPLSGYRSAMPHLMEWFQQRRVFGASGYPWASPDYHGDRDRQFSCPNMLATEELLFRCTISEIWSDEDLADLIAILRKVDAAFAK